MQEKYDLIPTLKMLSCSISELKVRVDKIVNDLTKEV
jgi:hypothetical protein